MSFLLRQLVKLGGLATIIGGLVFSIYLPILVYLLAVPVATAIGISVVPALVGAMIGLAIDTWLGFSSGIETRHYIGEQNNAKELLKEGNLTPQTALKKWVNAEIGLSNQPSLLSKVFKGNKTNDDELVWVVENVIPRLNSKYLPKSKNKLSAWLEITQDLVRIVSELRKERSVLTRILDRYSPNDLALEAAKAWEEKIEQDNKEMVEAMFFEREKEQMSGKADGIVIEKEMIEQNLLDEPEKIYLESLK